MALPSVASSETARGGAGLVGSLALVAAREQWWSGGTNPLLHGRGFHEKADPVKRFFSHSFLPVLADRREAPQRPRVLLLFSGSFSALAESPCFHSHSCWSGVLRCRLGSSISNGCCHLSIELTPLLPETLFRRDLAVTRTRRFATKLQFVPPPADPPAATLPHDAC